MYFVVAVAVSVCITDLSGLYPCLCVHITDLKKDYVYPVVIGKEGSVGWVAITNKHQHTHNILKVRVIKITFSVSMLFIVLEQFEGLKKSQAQVTSKKIKIINKFQGIAQVKSIVKCFCWFEFNKECYMAQSKQMNATVN